MSCAKRDLFAACIISLSCALTPALAQEQTVSIQGVATEMEGAPLPGVSITATSTRGATFVASTDNKGWYRFAAVPPDTYTVTATLAGMDAVQAANVHAPLGSRKKVDFRMKLSSFTEAITVTMAAPIVDVTSSSTSAVITAERLETLPLGRDIQSAVALAAGANAESLAGGISINGASGSENVWYLDGANVTDPMDGTVGTYVRTDFVDEIQVKYAGYMPEYGGAVGGVISALTKSGGNELKGSVNLYYEDESLNGEVRPWLQPTPDDSTVFAWEHYENDDRKMLEPGLTLGGPIVPGKVWIFGAYQPQIRSIHRTVTFTDGVTDTFSQDFRRDAGVASLSGTIGSRFLWRAVYNTAGYKEENLLPPLDGRATSAQSDYRGRTDVKTLWTATTYADYMATSSLAISLRGGRFVQNLSTEGYPADPQYWFWRGSSCDFVTGDRCQPMGYRTPSNSAVDYDEFARDYLHFDTSWFATLAGSHSVKIGAQLENLSNGVNRGNQAPLFRVYWGAATPWWGPEFSGPYGQVGIYEFKTTGDVEDRLDAFFIQDSWTTLSNRLTLNLGVRAERERIPGYARPDVGLPTYAIEFDFSDKVAPRVGFAYDLLGDGRWRAYGSYGVFYDILKLTMPRGTFGGPKWIWFNYAIMDPNWDQWSCTSTDWTDESIIPDCGEHLDYIGSIDIFPLSYDRIEPNLKPMESTEYTIGTEYELSARMSVGLRYVHKELVRTVEDVGILVDLPDGGSQEEYFTANPGEGIATYLLGPDFPAFPKPVRKYDAIDLTFTKRFSDNWTLHANYVYSRLWGNYPGLASSDEIYRAYGIYGAGAGARRQPNVLRFGDSLFSMFDASGRPVHGRLATDRPHQLKVQGSFTFPFGTTASINQYIGSGTPKSTIMFYEGVEFYPFGRGDQGRTPTLTQTDLFLGHTLRVFATQSIEIGVSVLNLFDEDTPVYYDPYYSEFDVSGVTNEEFFEGFDAYAAAGEKDPRFNLPYAFQAPREVRFHVKYRF